MTGSAWEDNYQSNINDIRIRSSKHTRWSFGPRLATLTPSCKFWWFLPRVTLPLIRLIWVFLINTAKSRRRITKKKQSRRRKWSACSYDWNLTKRRRSTADQNSQETIKCSDLTKITPRILTNMPQHRANSPDKSNNKTHRLPMYLLFSSGLRTWFASDSHTVAANCQVPTIVGRMGIDKNQITGRKNTEQFPLLKQWTLASFSSWGTWH